MEGTTMSTPGDRNLDTSATGRYDQGTGREAGTARDDEQVRQGGAHTTGRPGKEEFAAQRDQVRWGPLWAGIVITLAAYLLMQLAIFAAGLFNDGGDAGTWLTAAAALLAFFIGGLTVAGTALWHKVTDGVLHGVLLWAFATVGLLVLALIGGGTLLGPVSTVAADLVQIQNLNLQDVPAAQVSQALEGARSAAGWALLGLALALVAAAVGGAAGAKIWPGRDTAGTTAHDAEGTELRR